jgi:hypothetical protein
MCVYTPGCYYGILQKTFKKVKKEYKIQIPAEA